MTQSNSVATGTFDGIDLSDLDLLDIEVVQMGSSMGIPETGASCCPYVTCSSCCIAPDSV